MEKPIKTVEQAQAALESATAAFNNELERDCNRSPGSGAQERRRDEHLQKLRDTVFWCEKELEEAKRNSGSAAPNAKGE